MPVLLKSPSTVQIFRLLFHVVDTQRDKQNYVNVDLRFLLFLEIRVSKPCYGSEINIIPSELQKFAFSIKMYQKGRQLNTPAVPKISPVTLVILFFFFLNLSIAQHVTYNFPIYRPSSWLQVKDCSKNLTPMVNYI